MKKKNNELLHFGFLISIVLLLLLLSPQRSVAQLHKKITISVRNAPISDVIRMIARDEGLNVVISDSVKGKVSFFVKNISPQKAMQILKTEYSLVIKRVNKNTIVVMSAKGYVKTLTDEQSWILARKNTEDIKNEVLLPKDVKTIHLNYANAEEVGKMIKKLFFKSVKGNTDEVLTYKRLNDVVIKAPRPILKNVEHFIKKIDRPVKQVEIDARIVEINTTYEKSLGIQWGGIFENYYTSPATNKTFISVTGMSSSSGSTTNTTGSSTATVSSGFPSNPFNPSLSTTDNFIVNLPAQPQLAPTALNLGLLIGRADYNAELKITAGELEGYTKIISSPRIITNNGSEAKISNGQQIPYQETAGASGATSVSFKDASLSLNVLPRIADNGNIVMKITVAKDSPDYSHSVNGEPPINTQSVTTTVTVKSGETIVIGGLVQRTNEKTESGVPILKEIPLIGWLFSREDTYRPEYKLYVFIRPKIVNK